MSLLCLEPRIPHHPSTHTHSTPSPVSEEKPQALWFTRSFKIWLSPISYYSSFPAKLASLLFLPRTRLHLLQLLTLPGPLFSQRATWLTPHDLQVFVQISFIMKANLDHFVYIASNGVQGSPPQITPQWHIDYFELKSL